MRYYIYLNNHSDDREPWWQVREESLWVVEYLTRAGLACNESILMIV